MELGAQSLLSLNRRVATRDLRDLMKLPEQTCRGIFTLPKNAPEKIGFYQRRIEQAQGD